MEPGTIEETDWNIATQLVNIESEMADLSEELTKILNGTSLKKCLAKWVLDDGSNDNDELFKSSMACFDEDDWRDTDNFRRQRLIGKEDRYKVFSCHSLTTFLQVRFPQKPRL